MIGSRRPTLTYDDQRRDGMSLRAWGLYCYLAAQNPGASIRPEDVAPHVREGRDAIRAARDELVALGLLAKEEYTDGRLVRYRYVLDVDADTRATA